MLPLEYLRHLARWEGEGDGELLQEVAECLAAFEHDPIDLVMACRQLLVHHPANGSLWWMCARVCTADRPGRAARDAARVLREDQTAPRLAGALPFPHDDPIAVLGWPGTITAALAERPDLDVVAVDFSPRRNALRRRLRFAEPPVTVVRADEVDDLAPTHLLVEVSAASSTAALLPLAAVTALDGLASAGSENWYVVPAGRLLPDRLFTAAALAAGEGHGSVAIGPTTRVATPAGAGVALDLLRKPDCPVAPELLRPL